MLTGCSLLGMFVSLAIDIRAPGRRNMLAGMIQVPGRRHTLTMQDPVTGTPECVNNVGSRYRDVDIC